MDTNFDINTYIPTDEDRPRVKKITIKSNEISRKEYLEKVKFLYVLQIQWKQKI